MEARAKFKTIDGYIATFPEHVRAKLEKLRQAIKKAAPKAEEKISYQMPAFKLNRMLVYFAGYKNHIGFYPGSSGIGKFRKEISSYKSAKGSVQFPIDKPLPLLLISRIVRYRVKEDMAKRK